MLGSDASSTASLNFDTLNALDEMHRCMKESLRQAPPLIMLMREVHVPLAVKGARNQRYVVPVGDLVFAVPAVSMNLPDSAEDCVFKVRAWARMSILCRHMLSFHAVAAALVSAERP